MSDGKTQILFQATVTFKTALDDYAESKGVSASSIMREAIANAIGYDLAKDLEQLPNRKRYANKNVQKEAQKEEQKNRRKLERELWEFYKSMERNKDAEAFVNYLERRGHTDL